MTPEEKIANMTRAINGAIYVMEHSFESTKEDVARACAALKNSIAKDTVAPAATPTVKAA